MTALAALAVGIVIGFLLGGAGPRRELEIARAEVDTLEEELSEAEPRSGLRSPVPGLDQILRERPSDRFPDAGIPIDGGPAPDEREWDADPLSAFQRAASIQRVRSVQSRAALEQQAELEESELAEIDAAIEDMNEQLVGYGEELMLLALESETPPPGALLGITHDVTGILHRAQRQLEAVVGERMQRLEPEAAEIWNYVDLDRLEPAARAAMERAR